MRFLSQVVYSMYSFFLNINGSRSSRTTVIVKDLVKNGCSSRYLISQAKLVLLYEFYMWKILAITEKDYQVPKALERMLTVYSLFYLNKRPLATVYKIEENMKSCQIQWHVLICQEVMKQYSNIMLLFAQNSHMTFCRTSFKRIFFTL